MSKKRRKTHEISIHHRLTKRHGGTNDEFNLSEVHPMEHNAYNVVFRDGHMHPKQMAELLTKVWIRPDWIIHAMPRHENCLHCKTCRLEALNGTLLETPQTQSV